MNKNITSYFIGGTGSGIVCESKEEFLLYLSEEIDRVEENGQFCHFDVTVDCNNG